MDKVGFSTSHTDIEMTSTFHPEISTCKRLGMQYSFEGQGWETLFASLRRRSSLTEKKLIGCTVEVEIIK
jgi:hypothetical protein